MEITTVSVLGGVIIGVIATLFVYPFILKQRAAKLLIQCSTTAKEIGDPLSQYFALLVYELTAVYKRLDGKEVEQAKVELSEILASYASFVKSKRYSRYSGEQTVLQAIDEACSKSETLRRIVDERVKSIKDKTLDQMLKELENEAANQASEPIPLCSEVQR